jgi:hypothetical protein
MLDLQIIKAGPAKAKPGSALACRSGARQRGFNHLAFRVDDTRRSPRTSLLLMG